MAARELRRPWWVAAAGMANAGDRWQVSQEMVDNGTGGVFWLAEPRPDPFL
jgi:hypothetical protein